MSESILRLAAVKARTGLSRTAIYAKMGRGEFPPSVALGERAVGWVESEVSRWIEQRIHAARAAARVRQGEALAQPAQIVRRSNL